MLRRQQVLLLGAPTLLFAVAAYALSESPANGLMSASLALVLTPVSLHALLLLGSVKYRVAWRRSCQVRAERIRLQQALADRFDAFRVRARGESFKKAYGLAGRDMRSLEEALAVGMYRERREVFVTAFMRSGVVVRVTASIGSSYRCRPADDPAKWRDHVDRLRCDEVRQYHNHPVHEGSTTPSDGDIRSSRQFERLLGPHASKLRSFIICWNRVGEWRVIEYNARNEHWMHYEFDIARQRAGLCERHGESRLWRHGRGPTSNR
ncbi:hypothetical protein [Spiribacter onubensis]|uniref:Uncharacterized protein n=1 Tax=Spiribacter onubensis TaxID=3122420 RepID=A0ABV3S786_9GAMM